MVVQGIWRVAAVLGLIAASARSAAADEPKAEQPASPTTKAENDRRLQQASQLEQEVVRLYREGKYAEAEAKAREVLEIRTQVLGERHASTATAICTLATMLQMQGKLTAARTLFERGLAIQQETLGAENLETAYTLSSLAYVRQLQGEFAQAGADYERTLKIVEKIGGHTNPLYSRTLNQLATFYHDQGDLRKARDYYDQALAVRKSLYGEESAEYAVVLDNLAILLSDIGDYRASQTACERALAIRKKVLRENHPQTLTSMNNLAHLLRVQGDLPQARRLYEQVLRFRRETSGEHTMDYAYSLNNLGVSLKEMGDDAGALPLYEQALAILKENGAEGHELYTFCLENLCSLHASRGDLVRASDYCEQTLQVSQRTVGKNHPDYAQRLILLAHLLRRMQRPAEAQAAVDRALTILAATRGKNHPDYTDALLQQAWLQMDQGDFDSARGGFDQGLTTLTEVLGPDHPYCAGYYQLLGQALWALGRTAEAETKSRKAVALGLDQIERAAPVQSERQQLAEVVSLRGRLDQYLSIALAAQRPPDEIYATILRWKGAVSARQRHNHEQYRLLRDTSDETRARVLELQDVTRRLAALALKLPAANARDAWTEQIARFSRQAERLEAELSQRSDAFRAARRAAPTVASLQQALPAATALIDVFEYRKLTAPARAGQDQPGAQRRLLAFVVCHKGAITSHDLGPVQPIQDAIDRWRVQMKPGGDARIVAEASTQLRTLIWEPLEPDLAGIKTVALAPDGPLTQFPLAALPGSSPGSYLIEELAIFTVPVPQLLAEPAPAPAHADRQAEERPASLLLVGDVDFGPRPASGEPSLASRGSSSGAIARALPMFAPLEETRGEILAVRDSFEGRFPDGKALVLRGGNATESALRIQIEKFPYLHLATHGFFAPGSLRSALEPPASPQGSSSIDPFGGRGIIGFHPGLLSGLVLAGANQPPTSGDDDGILTALEVGELDLSLAELVVLSACETGLGEQTAGGEGLLGLQRAFQVAGAQNVMASLWKVGDQATRALMERFYENLWEQRMPPARALRAAQLWMLREGRGRGLEPAADPNRDDGRPQRLSPYSWASFTLSKSHLTQ